jgi:CRISPR-associated protein (TIGR02584 family)
MPVRKILLVLSGPRAGLVSSSLYAAVEILNFLPDEILVLTTPSCREVLEENALSHILECCKAWNFTPPRFHAKNSVIAGNDPLADFTVTDPLFTDAMSTILYELTNQNTEVLISIAGGRKSMSIAAALAMSIYARPCDDMFHVIISEHAEKSGLEFPRNAQEAPEFKAAKIPFLRLRNKLESEYLAKSSFTELQHAVQADINQLVQIPLLKASIVERTIIINGQKIALTPKEIAIYTFFLKAELPVKGGKQFSNQHLDELRSIYLMINQHYGRGLGIQSFENDVQKCISEINRKLNNALGTLANHYQIIAKGAYGNKEYSIPLAKNKIQFINQSGE